ncbi:importin-9-like protein [Sarcoptes scabiei]|uniref:Importin-9-like protein n=1 Tax=Sarcoptes scabiei TaxID=52283 RepID=A0A131ZWK5_SARSC|nr:importin-9-like protein [Sarcoptes scabiei]
MSSSASQNYSLKEIICDNLYRSLSSDKNIRENAEQQLNMLETNEDHVLHLMEISLSENLDFSIRHLASVLLNRYIFKHWCSNSNRFEQPEMNPTIKQLLREYLLKSLAITSSEDKQISKLLNSFAHTVSTIAQFDWPQDWPQLFPTLNLYLNSGQSNTVNTSLKVFKELAHEITDTQIPDIAPILLPRMLEIFISSSYPLQIRIDAIKIFGIIAETIIIMDELHRNAIKRFLVDVIPVFIESSIKIMLLPDDSYNHESISLRKEIIAVFTKLLRHCRKYVQNYLPKILSLVWQELTKSANIYCKILVNPESNDESLGNSSVLDIVDSDGELMGFESFVYTILEFVSSVFESVKYRALIKSVLSELLYYILFFVQITHSQIEKWQSNMDQLIEEDDVDTSAYSIRIAAQDLILNLAKEMTTDNEKHPKKNDELFKISFVQAIQRHFSEASESQEVNKSNSWKIVESCLYALGLLAPTIIFTINSEKRTANEYKIILDNVLLNLNLNEPFLAGRSLWTASRFSQIMNDETLDKFLKLTSSLLNTTEAPILRIYSLRASSNFIENIHAKQKLNVIKPYLQSFLQGLLTFGHTSNDDTLHLILHIICQLIELDNELAIAFSDSICSLAFEAFLKNPDDAIMFDTVLSILDRLFSIEKCLIRIQDHLLPKIVSMLNGECNSASLNSMQFNNDLYEKSLNILHPHLLDILSKIINRYEHLNDYLVNKAYPSVIDCISKASKDDSAIFQNGSECLSVFLKKGSDLLVQYVDPVTYQNGIFMAFNICVNLLNPNISDSAAAYIGRVIVILMMKCGQWIERDNIEHLLRSTLVRLNKGKELLLIQTLIMVFAHLFYTDLSTILIFLNSLPAPCGERSALEFVLDKWLGIQRYLCGYNNKASTVALCLKPELIRLIFTI